MPTFITIGYGDSVGHEETHSAIRNAAHEHVEEAVKLVSQTLCAVADGLVRVRPLQTTN